ncbi:MAG: phage major capsid protein [Candidatus Abyssobacteria bacterium SURF_17]|uniref:Phage major capsid protein n=1 Tax=Candidatus Abyssobacteria bacterium SURF_17 TaxID=2093361 RepID=A0A419F326_9BACT|nr:MAG: phage major capsid protein [Candidatus Abyssubacteria bacterium SURF_17]
MSTTSNEVLSIVRAIREKVERDSDKGKIREMIREALKKQQALKMESSIEELTPLHSQEIHGICKSLPAELQQKADDLYLVSKLLRRDPRTLKMWREFNRDASELRKALDTASPGEGLEWVPTGFSTELIRKVRLEQKVSALHARIFMPTNPFKLPVDGSGVIVYLAEESKTDTAPKILASTPGTGAVTFDAVKIGCRVFTSVELTEDGIIPVLPLLQEKIVRALADAQEDATINGDSSPSHMDADISSPLDVRKAWKGYRKLAISSAKVDCSEFNVTTLRAIRSAMGRWGVNPSDLAWITGISVFNKMLGLPEVLTVDKYGSNATILTGELAKLDGIPVIVSEFVREDLNVDGVYDGITTTKTILPLVYRPGLLYGDRRTIKLRVSHELYMETEQIVAIAMQRLDFRPLEDTSSRPIVGLGINIGN